MIIDGEGVTKTSEGARVAIMLITPEKVKLAIADASGERSLWLSPGEQVTIGGRCWHVERITDGDRADCSVQLG